jgi:transposase
MMLYDRDDATGEDGHAAALTGSARRRRWSAAEKAAVVRETLVLGARVSEVARRWQVDAQQVYRWRHNEGVTQRRTMHGGHAAEPAFVPIVTEAMPVREAAPAASASPVIEVRLAGAVVCVVPGLDDAQLTAVLRAVRASVLRA